MRPTEPRSRSAVLFAAVAAVTGMHDQHGEWVRAEQRRRARLRLAELEAGDQVRVCGHDGDVTGSVVAMQVDSEGDPMVVLVSSTGRRSVLAIEYAALPDTSIQRISDRNTDRDEALDRSLEL